MKKNGETEHDIKRNSKAALKSQELFLANLLQEYRKSMKLSRQQIAQESGLTRQMVSKVETYTSTPTLTT